MIIVIVVVLVPINALHAPGIYPYLGFAVLAFIYGFIVKGKNTISRITIIIMAESIFAYGYGI